MIPHPQSLYMIHAITPLRVGADQGIGAIDLPTLREAHTSWPIVPGSSVKGVLREQAELHLGGRESAEVRAIFGPPTELAGDYRGGMVFGDAYPLLLPVRSLAGTFAWVTCAQVLRRLARDAAEAGLQLELPAAVNEAEVRIPSNSSGTKSELVVVDRSAQSRHVLFEDLYLEADDDPKLTALGKMIAPWVWPLTTDGQKAEPRAESFLLSRLALVPDDVFGYLCRHRLEIRARVSIDDTTGTVKHGPWTEELIPAETVLCGIVQARGTAVRTRKQGKHAEGRNGEEEDFETTDDPQSPNAVLGYLRKLLEKPRMLRLGGHGSVGLGRARVTLVTKAHGKEPKQ